MKTRAFTSQKNNSNPDPGPLLPLFQYSPSLADRFLLMKTAQGLGSKRLRKIERMFRILKKAGFEPKPSANIEEIQRIVIWINTRPYTAWTKWDYQRFIRELFIFAGKRELVEWLKPKEPQPVLLRPGELITWQDILNVIRFVRQERFRAFIALLYDSGARIGEILPYDGSKGLSYNDIYRDAKGARIYIDGKTGPRLIRLQRSFPYLLEYLPTAPRTGPLFPRSYTAYKKVIDRAFTYAEIKKQHNFHYFRKSRSDELSNYLTDAQRCRFFGWIIGSKVLRTYSSQMANQAVDDAILSIPP